MPALHQRDADDTRDLHAGRRKVDPALSSIDSLKFHIVPAARRIDHQSWRIDAELSGIDSLWSGIDPDFARIVDPLRRIDAFRGRSESVSCFV